MQAIYIKDKQIYEVSKLDGVYLIDNIPRTLKREDILSLTSLDNIRKVTQTQVLDYYIKDDEKLFEKEYKNIESDLLNGSTYDSYEGQYIFTDIDKEYAYKKWRQGWNKIYKTIETISEPLTIPILFETQINTNNVYITNMYLNGESKEDRYKYDRITATLDIVKNKFSKLDMMFNSIVGYGETKNKKVWGNSTHSHLRYVVAFGTYIFSQKWDIKNNPTGNLQYCLDYYNNDKEELEQIIENNYLLHFGKYNNNEQMVNEIYDKLKRTCKQFQKVNSKVSTQFEYKTSLKFLNEALELIPKLMKHDKA